MKVCMALIPDLTATPEIIHNSDCEPRPERGERGDAGRHPRRRHVLRQPGKLGGIHALRNDGGTQGEFYNSVP